MAESKTKKIAKPKAYCLVQFNQVKGTKQGKIDQQSYWQLNEQQKYQFKTQNQTCKELSRDYLIALHDPSTGKIQWKQAIMFQAKTNAIQQNQTGTTIQKWSIEHKKNMVSQFGTSKSKRKINQMLSNIIN